MTDSGDGGYRVGAAEADNRLMERAQAGDNAAWAAIWEQYHTPIRGFVFRMVKDPDLADDLTADAFTRAFERRHQYREKINLRSWLYRIAQRVVIDWKRRPTNAGKLALNDADDESLLGITDPGPDVDESLLAHEQHAEAQRLLDDMPVDLRNTLALYLDDVSLREHSRRLCIPFRALTSRAWRARNWANLHIRLHPERFASLLDRAQTRPIPTRTTSR